MFVAIFVLAQGFSHAFTVAPLRHGHRASLVLPPPRSAPAAAVLDDGLSETSAKRIRKLKKNLKRIGELRHKDYLTLTTDQRVKIHGEHRVLAELASLLLLNDPDEQEALRMTLQPGLAKPMPPSQEWSFEVGKERAKAKVRERRELEATLQLRPGELPKGGNVRKGDWRCPSCGVLCWASRDTCFTCGEPR